jgi:hypothetical protein
METWEELTPKNCGVCNYPLSQHGTGLGIPNDYIPCEYCFLKRTIKSLTDELAAANKVAKMYEEEIIRLKKRMYQEWQEGHTIGLAEGRDENAPNL